MTEVATLESDAFVFFGATGDLAFRQIFPALQALIRRGHFDMPIIGVTRFGASAPGPIVMREFGFTPEHVVETANAVLKRTASS